MWGAAIAAVGSWLASKSQKKSQKNQMEDQAKLQREMLEMQRKWQLEDRAYRQGAAGAWSKFANPAFMPQTYNSQMTCKIKTICRISRRRITRR